MPRVDGRNQANQLKLYKIYNSCSITHWKLIMGPKNGGLEDNIPFELGDFFHVNFPGCKKTSFSSL